MTELVNFLHEVGERSGGFACTILLVVLVVSALVFSQIKADRKFKKMEEEVHYLSIEKGYKGESVKWENQK